MDSSVKEELIKICEKYLGKEKTEKIIKETTDELVKEILDNKEE